MLVYDGSRALAALLLRLFFRRIEVEGREHLPPSGPAILVANHVNGLVDPALPMVTQPRRLTFVAKSTLDRIPILGLLARQLGAVYVQRTQDLGDDAPPDPARNAAAFARVREALRGGALISIFPEGISHSEAALQPFRTGPARMALDYLDAGAASGGAATHSTAAEAPTAPPASPAPAARPPLWIIPAALVFSAKTRFRSSVWVRYGPAIDAAAWRAAHPHAGPRELTALMQARVADLLVSFEDRQQAALARWSAQIVLAAARGPLPVPAREPRPSQLFQLVAALFAGWKVLAAEAPDEVAALVARIERHRERLRQLGLRPDEVHLPLAPGLAARFAAREVAVALLAGGPALAGLAANLLPYHATALLTRLVTRDEDQWATNGLLAALVLFPLCWIGQGIALGLAAGSAAAAAYALLLLPCGLVALHWRERTAAFGRRVRTFLRLVLSPSLRAELLAESRAIAAAIGALAARLPSHLPSPQSSVSIPD